MVQLQTCRTRLTIESLHKDQLQWLASVAMFTCKPYYTRNKIISKENGRNTVSETTAN